MTNDELVAILRQVTVILAPEKGRGSWTVNKALLVLDKALGELVDQPTPTTELNLNPLQTARITEFTQQVEFYKNGRYLAVVEAEQLREELATVKEDLTKVKAKLAHAEKAYYQTANEVENILGQAMGYPWFKDDQQNFPGATEADGVCVGEHVPASIAEEAAKKLKQLINPVGPNDYHCAHHDEDAQLIWQFVVQASSVDDAKVKAWGISNKKLDLLVQDERHSMYVHLLSDWLATMRNRAAV